MQGKYNSFILKSKNLVDYFKKESHWLYISVAIFAVITGGTDIPTKYETLLF